MSYALGGNSTEAHKSWTHAAPEDSDHGQVGQRSGWGLAGNPQRSGAGTEAPRTGRSRCSGAAEYEHALVEKRRFPVPTANDHREENGNQQAHGRETNRKVGQGWIAGAPSPDRGRKPPAVPAGWTGYAVKRCRRDRGSINGITSAPKEGKAKILKIEGASGGPVSLMAGIDRPARTRWVLSKGYR
jgi:hypothetical protein